MRLFRKGYVEFLPLDEDSSHIESLYCLFDDGQLTRGSHQQFPSKFPSLYFAHCVSGQIKWGYSAPNDKGKLRRRAFNGWIFGLRLKTPIKRSQRLKLPIEQSIAKQQYLIERLKAGNEVSIEQCYQALKLAINAIALDVTENFSDLDVIQHNSVVQATKQDSCSTRTFHRQFVKRYGMSPKQLFGVERFHHSLTSVSRSSVSLSECAYQLNFADQSHFSREFKRFSGLSPKQFRQYWRQFITGNDRFVQDCCNAPQIRLALLANEEQYV